MSRFEEMNYGGVNGIKWMDAEDLLRAVVIELCNLSDKCDMMMDHDINGYYNLKSVIERLNTISADVKDIEKLADRITTVPNDSSKYQNLHHVIYSIDSLKKSLASLEDVVKALEKK